MGRYLIFESRSLTGTWGSLIRLGWMHNEPPGALCLQLPRIRMKNTHHCAQVFFFYTDTGDQTRVPLFAQQHFTNKTISSVPNWEFLRCSCYTNSNLNPESSVLRQNDTRTALQRQMPNLIGRRGLHNHAATLRTTKVQHCLICLELSAKNLGTTHSTAGYKLSGSSLNQQKCTHL